VVLATVALALLVGAVFAVLIAAIASSRGAQRRALHSQDVLNAANSVELQVLDLETGQRGFLLTHQTDYLTIWQQAREALPKSGPALVALVSRDAQQVARAREIVAGARSYVDDYSVPLVTAAQRNDPSARTIAATAEGEARVDAMRGLFSEMIDAEHRTSVASARASTDDAHRAYVVAVVGVAGVVALLVLYTGYLNRAIVGPIRRTARATDVLASGDLAARVTENGVGEIGALQHAFNGMAASLERGRDDLAASRARLVTSADDARRRIERDLHDGAQQQLIKLAVQLRAIASKVPADREELATELDGVVAGLRSALEELRELASGIHPPVLSQGGLVPALKELARRSTVPVELDVNIDDRVPEAVEVAAYYVVSEALANAAKHAQAKVVNVKAEAQAGKLEIIVRDDGVGGADFAGGSGLVGLRDRVEALGGRVALQSELSAGTSLAIELPLTEPVATSS
jgi:signal transduction histidine kinase